MSIIIFWCSHVKIPDEYCLHVQIDEQVAVLKRKPHLSDQEANWIDYITNNFDEYY